MISLDDELSSVRIIVTGTRKNGPIIRMIVFNTLSEWSNRINTLLDRRADLVIVEGACIYGGVDEYAFEWALEHPDFVKSERYPAKDHKSPTARNSYMVSLGGDLCIGFPAPGSEGTWDALKKACNAGIHIEVVSV